MDIVYWIVLIAHIACWGAVLVVWLLGLENPKVTPGQAHGASGALVTGIILVALAFADDKDLNLVKISVKLAVALAAVALAFARKSKPAPDPMVHVLGGLVVLNVLLALVW